MESSPNLATVYDQHYFQHGCGLPYERSQHWLTFFGTIADQLVRAINPGSVLDAGCAMGFLVEALRDRGVAASGVDISEYAIDQVREDVRPYCWVGSILEPFPNRYDLIVCIEVLEHLPAQEAGRAIANLCQVSDDVLISSSPDDYRETTHFNVQPPEYWAELFARQGFFRDVDFDASFITPWSMRFRSSAEPASRLVMGYERRLWRLTQQTGALRDLVNEQRKQLADATTDATTKDQAMQMLTGRLEEQERTAQERTARLAESERTVAGQKQMIQTLTAQRAGQERLALGLSAQVEALAGEVRAWETHWQQVQHTVSWATAQKLQSLRKRVAPDKSKRDLLWATFARRRT